ncbi:hypothetical protein [uncultured Ferrimonas sp.]|uniref:hypothetical protein n=1 Tax=uncultured Ferrimonas sp. TaxID=432640 RepID=UPI0026301984|nr:hypothetical protein [uncultured Ferrimonas sp.]
MNQQQIFIAASNAIDFYRMAKRGMLAGMINIGTPAIVCSEFSAELAMKAIIYSEGSKCRGHKLIPLMNRLPKDVQSEIEDELSSEWPDYKAQLENCDNAFVDWRYLHEVENELFINAKFLLLFSEICCKIAMKRLEIKSNIPIEDIY